MTENSKIAQKGSQTINKMYRDCFSSLKLSFSTLGLVTTFPMEAKVTAMNPKERSKSCRGAYILAYN
jgi:hypothetical protein